MLCHSNPHHAVGTGTAAPPTTGRLSCRPCQMTWRAESLSVPWWTTNAPRCGNWENAGNIVMEKCGEDDFRRIFLVAVLRTDMAISWLVGGLEHEFNFSIYWEESSQLTFIFFRGVGQPPTTLYIYTYIYIIYIYTYIYI